MRAQPPHGIFLALLLSIPTAHLHPLVAVPRPHLALLLEVRELAHEESLVVKLVRLDELQQVEQLVHLPDRTKTQQNEQEAAGGRRAAARRFARRENVAREGKYRVLSGVVGHRGGGKNGGDVACVGVGKVGKFVRGVHEETLVPCSYGGAV